PCGGVLVRNPAGVGEERRVEVGRDRGADRSAELAEQAIDHLAGRARRPVDEIDRAERGVAEVVVDVDDGAGALHFDAALTEPSQSGAVEGEDGPAEGRPARLDCLESW